jgi:hypothetical protein
VKLSHEDHDKMVKDGQRMSKMTKVVEALTQDNQGLAKLPNKIGANLSGARSRLQTLLYLQTKFAARHTPSHALT